MGRAPPHRVGNHHGRGGPAVEAGPGAAGAGMTERDWASLLPTFDMFDPAHEEWKYEGFAWAREHCPIIHGSPPSTGPRTIVTRYADVRQILEDPDTFSSA